MESATMEQTAPAEPLNLDELQKLDAYWRAANYLSVGQIYLLDNPLLRQPLMPGLDGRIPANRATRAFLLL